MSIVTDGLVLKVNDTGESDRIVTLLTADYGVIRAFANRAKKLNSKIQAATQTLCYGTFTVYTGKDSYIIESAEAKEVFFGLRQDIEKLSLGQYFCSLAADLVPEGEPAEDILRVILNSLFYLQNGKRSADFLKAVTELKIISLSGFAPDLICCSECGDNPIGNVSFSTGSGRFWCLKHGAGEFVITPGVLTAMRHIVANPVNRLYSFALSPTDEKQLMNVCEKFLLARTNRKYKALDFYKTVSSGS